MPRNLIKLIDGATTTVDGDKVSVDQTSRSFQAILEGTGSVTATVVIDGSNDTQSDPGNIRWVDSVVGIMTLSGTNFDSVGFGSDIPWLMARARVVAITGTDATIDVIMNS